MQNNIPKNVCCLLFIACMFSCQVSAAIKVHPDNPHYVMYKGQPTILITTAEHYGSVLNLNFDYVTYFDELNKYGFNLTRTFVGSYRENSQPGKGHSSSPLSPGFGRENFISPWAWSDKTGGIDGWKFDLDQWNPHYFARLKDFCRQAHRRGVVVELVLFCRMYSDKYHWKFSPLHPDNCLQGTPWKDLPYNRFLTLDNPELVKRQRQLIRKMIDELRGYDNVYFEIANEPNGKPDVVDWHNEMTAEINTHQASWPRDERFMIAVYANIYDDFSAMQRPPQIQMVTGHYWKSVSYLLDNFYSHNLVLSYDENCWISHTRHPQYKNSMLPEEGRVEAWEFIVGGGGVYDNLNHAYQTNNPTGRSEQSDRFKSYLRTLIGFVKQFNYLKMSPDTSTLVKGVPDKETFVRVLSERGSQYAIYMHHSGTKHSMHYVKNAKPRHVRLTLDLPPGNYLAQWVDPANAKVIGHQKLKHSGGHIHLKKSPRYDIDIALKIVKQ